MLVVCNGSMKSGSTWITQIIESHGKWSPIPDEFRNKDWATPSLAPELYSGFFKASKFESENWFCKQHWREEEKYTRLLYEDHVRVLNIVRDLRDVVVSRYFHDIRLGQTTKDNIQEYYFQENGRALLINYIEYHNFWHGLEKKKQPHLCVFENLINDFDDEIGRIFKYLGQAIYPDDLTRIYEATRFKNIKQTGDGHFFRKGQIGDWKNHLSTELIDDIRKTMVSYDYPHQELQQSFRNS